MYNLVEALPVLPGPCQLLNYQKVKEFNVVKEYFRLLFKSDHDEKKKKTIELAPKIFMRKKNTTFDQQAIFRQRSLYEQMKNNLAYKSEFSDSESDDDNDEIKLVSKNFKNRNFMSQINSNTNESNDLYDDEIYSNNNNDNNDSNNNVYQTKNPLGKKIKKKKLSEALLPTRTLENINLKEFLRLNMRLAEDRILSFVSVFCTGHGTKWIPGFCYYFALLLFDYYYYVYLLLLFLFSFLI
jgi:hypothetical protein